jgi:hypothetical protein
VHDRMLEERDTHFRCCVFEQRRTSTIIVL